MTYVVSNTNADATGSTSALDFLGDALPICGSLVHRPPASATSPIFTPTIIVPVSSVAQGTWVRVTGLTADASVGTTLSDDTIKVKASGCYRLNVTGLVSQNDAISRTMIAGITINDKTATLPISSVQALSGGFSTDTDRMFNVSIDEIIELQKDDFVSLYFNGVRDSGTAPADYEIHTFSFNLSRASGAYTEEDLAISPADLNPTLWFDATDPNNITESGGEVSQWDDLSQNAFHMTSPGAFVLRPNYVLSGINGLPSISFDPATQQGMERSNVLGSDILSATEVTIFVVSDLDPEQSNSAQVPFQFIDTGLNARCYVSTPTSGTTTTTNLAFGLSSPPFSTTTGTLLGQPNVMAYRKDATTAEIRQNGVSLSSGAFSNTLDTGLTGFIKTGAGGAPGVVSLMNGLLSEIIVYPRSLAISEIEQIESYLISKYGI